MRLERHKRESRGVEGDLSRFETFSAYVRDLLGAVAGKGAKRRAAGPLRPLTGRDSETVKKENTRI